MHERFETILARLEAEFRLLDIYVSSWRANGISLSPYKRHRHQSEITKRTNYRDFLIRGPVSDGSVCEFAYTNHHHKRCFTTNVGTKAQRTFHYWENLSHSAIHAFTVFRWPTPNILTKISYSRSDRGMGTPTLLNVSKAYKRENSGQEKRISIRELCFYDQADFPATLPTLTFSEAELWWMEICEQPDLIPLAALKQVNELLERAHTPRHRSNIVIRSPFRHEYDGDYWGPKVDR